MKSFSRSTTKLRYCLLVPDRFVIRILHIAAHGPDSANGRASASERGVVGSIPCRAIPKIKSVSEISSKCQ